MPESKEFYSLEEVAELLGVHYQLIYRLVRSGELPAVRLGRVYRVGKDDLHTYLEQQKVHVRRSGGECTACGKYYQSSLSLQEGCQQCGAPICRDCWQRLEVRNCREHRQS